MSLKKTENINENNMDPSECMNETDNRNICFLPDEHFFILDSEHLDRTETSFFGFCISDGILIDGNSNQKISAESLSGCGAYISITRSENEILIRQDYLGCYGLYLYQSSDGFVISNSFYYLLTYLKGRKLTINTDYVNAMQVVELCSMFYSETMIKEIEMLPSNVVLHIDIPKKELQTEILPHKEESVDLDSRPAFQILDSWFDRWTTFFRNLQKCTDNIQVALSGGFDSRVTFMLALCSGMDLNRVRINSIKDNLHTHEEDYLIAEKIAEHFHFRLNSHSLKGAPVNCTAKDVFDMALYGKLPFHKQMYFKYKKNTKKYFLVSGAGGEMLRSYWDMSADELIEQYAERIKSFPHRVRKDLDASLHRIFDRTLEKLSADCASDDINNALYRYVRCRNHFGRAIVEDSWINQLQITPWIDPELALLKRRTDTFNDANLLYTLILVRYCPDLLSFPFEGERVLSTDTIKYAETLNMKYPRERSGSDKLDFHESSLIAQDERSKHIIGRPSVISNRQMESALKHTVDQSIFREAKSDPVWDACIWRAVKNYYVENFHPLRYFYPNIAAFLVRGALDGKESYSWFIHCLSSELDHVIKEEQQGFSPSKTRPVILRDRIVVIKFRIKSILYKMLSIIKCF